MVIKLKQEAEHNLSISACPHDCPSTCALEISHDTKQIYNVKGSDKNTYTDGIICAKTARYRERTHHPDRLLNPYKRTGEKGLNNFKKIGWEEALDIVSENFIMISNFKSNDIYL